MKPYEFWDYSLMEIEDLLESHARKQRNAFKDEISKESRLAQFIAADIAYSLNGEKKVVMPWDMFEELFAEEKEIYVQKCIEADFDEFKNRRRAYAAEFNRRKRREV